MRRAKAPMIDHDEERPRGDMTPMIDIIFLLLIFFLLTTRFLVPEKVIAQLLPTDKGSGVAVREVTPPSELAIRIYPAGLHRGMGVEELHQLWPTALAGDEVYVQVGNNPPLRLRGLDLRGVTTAAELEPVMGRIREHIHAALMAAEEAGDRAAQRPINIHSFSALPWKYALVVYDSVRDYERQRAPGLVDLRQAREVVMAPPRVRGYSTREQGNELWEIMRF